MKLHLLNRAIVCFMTVVLIKTVSAQTFEGLGYLYDYEFSDSQAMGVSGDGSVIIGTTISLYNGTVVKEAFRWTEDEGMQGLGALWLQNQRFFSQGLNISDDGNVIVGYSKSENSFAPWGNMGWEAFQWTEGEGMQGLGDLTDTDYWSEGVASSTDGSVIVGRSLMTGQGLRWENGNLESLSTEDIQFSEATGVSGDGTIVVGSAIINDFQQAAIWIKDEGIFGLGFEDFSVCANVSADGNTIVGYYFENGESQPSAFRWTQETGIIDLGDFGGVYSTASDVSDDGSIVVGAANQNNDISDLAAFIWTEENGIQDLRELMENNYGLDLTGWKLITANAISGDGKTIVGTGLNPDGKQEAWRIVIPSSSGGECIAPNTFLLEEITETSVMFSWEPSPSEVNGYNWFVMNVGQFPGVHEPAASGTTEPGTTSAFATGLAPGTTYLMFIQARCNGDEVSDYGGPFMITTMEDMGITEFQNQLTLYPNPTTGVINLQTKEKINSVSIYNLVGQNLPFNSINKENTSIDISNLSNGIYFVEIILNDKTIKRHKVIKK